MSVQAGGEDATPTEEYRVLGPLTVVLAGRSAPVTAPKQRIILATLLLRAGTWVTAAELANALWDDRAPKNPRSALQVHLTRLRALIAAVHPERPDLIETRPGAYRIVVPPGSLDLDRYRDAIAQARAARRAGSADVELAWLQQALAQWRGDPLALVPSARIQREVVTALQDDRLRWMERRFELALATGRHAQVIGELRAATLAHPERERLWGQLMDALAETGDRAAAIAAYHQARGTLRNDLGATPDTELRPRYRRLIAATGQRRRNVAISRAGVDVWRAQCQLPPDIADFVGRVEIVRDLCTTLESGDTPVVCLTGVPGVGKSALAVRVAHHLRTRFPDGQWYLCGSERTWPDILAEMLATSGVEQPPTSTTAAVALLRRRLAGRRLLVTIDDAPEGLPPHGLLPLPAGCVALAVRRGDPPALGCDVAHVVTLDVLSPAEAAALVTDMVGQARVGRTPAALEALVERCDRLPLALRIAGAHLVTHPTRDIGEFAELLGADPLGTLSLPGSRRAAVRTAFELAYSALPPAVRRVFRFLELVPGFAHRVETIAELTGMSPSDAAGTVADLVRARIAELGPDGVIRLHSLVARFAAERGLDEDPPADRQAALVRLGTRLLTVADEAVRLCHPDVVRVGAGIGTATFGSHRAARTWLQRERRNLVAVAVHAAAAGLTPLAVGLTDALRGPCGADRHHGDWRIAAEAAVAATDRLREPAYAAVARLNLGLALQGLNDLGPAEIHLRHACDQLRRRGPAELEVVAVTALAMHRLQQPTKRFHDAIGLLHRGLRQCRQLGLRHAQARCLLYLGMAHHARGELRLAYRQFSAAARIDERAGDYSAKAEILARLGDVCVDLGAHREAVRRLRTALRLGRSARSAHSVALASYGLARVRRATGRPKPAHSHVARAIAFAESGGYLAVLVNARNLLAGLYRDEGLNRRAELEYRRALREAERIGHPGARCEALTGLALLAHERGRDHQVPVMARQATGAARAAGSPRLLSQVRELLAPLQPASSRR
ncbi:BTAD domain-containing putative transcriptional regulator [Micromonospora sp. NPDC049114]|uniref:AfsR/SARP family transcriptional regulator n=1 Tax=unclassified Micromonospora TaxID=2617518 RepID=UPI0033ECB80E